MNKKFAAIWIVASLVGGSFAFVPQLQSLMNRPMKTILILNVDGQIDSTLFVNFKAYFSNHRAPDYLILQMNSPGGWSNDVAAIGWLLLALEAQGTAVIFIPVRQCTSGCFWLSSYADQVIVDSGTTYGFGHDVKNSTIAVSGFGNPNSVSAFYVAIQAITSLHEYEYTIILAQIPADSTLGPP